MMRRLDTSIGQRLALGYGVVLMLLVAVVGAYTVGQQRQEEMSDRLTDLIMPRVDAANGIESAYLSQSGAAQAYIYSGDPRYLDEYQKAVADGEAAVARLGRLPETGTGDTIFAQMQSLAVQYATAAQRGIDLRRQGQAIDAQRVLEQEMIPTRDQLVGRTEAFVALQFRLRDEANAELDRVQAETRDVSIALAFLALLIGVAVSYLAARSVRNPTRGLVEASRALSGGDFSAAIEQSRSIRGVVGQGTRDEIRELAGNFAGMAEALQLRDKRTLARARLSSELSTSMEVAPLVTAALREVADFVGADLGLVYVVEGSDQNLRLVGSFLASAEVPEALSLSDGIPGEALASGRRVVVRDIPADTPFRIGFGFDNVPPRTVVAVPMLVQQRSFGVAVLGSLHDLSADALDFVDISVQQLAVSLQNALAYRGLGALASELQEKNELLASQNEELQAQAEEIQSQNEELQSQNEEIQAQNEELQSQSEEIQSQNEELQAQNEEIQAQREGLAERNLALAAQAERITRLQAISTRLSEGLSAEGVLEQVVSAASDLLDSTIASVLLLDQTGEFFRPAASIGLEEGQRETLRLGRQESLAGHAVAERQTHFIEDVSQHPEVRFPTLAAGKQVGAILVAPLLVGSRELGAVEVYFTEPRTFSQDEIDLLTALASAAAVAVHNAGLLEDSQRQSEMLREVDRAKDEFLSIVSHELKSPLTAVKGFAQLLGRENGSRPDQEQTAKMMRTLNEQVDRVVRLVDRLLDLSRAQMGRLELYLEPMDLAEVARQQVQAAQVKTDKHHLVLDAPDSLVGNWDRGYLEQVISNLLDNAVRYSPRGGDVKISLQRQNGAALLVVEDTGIGIPREVMPHIFQRHFRSREAKRVKADGMGIGLYLTRQIVEVLGGNISVESEAGRGSVFTVELPLNQAMPEASSTA